MAKKIITIAREYGAGGREIAQKVAEQLQITYYDNDIIDRIAAELGFDIETIRKASNEKSSSFMYTMSYNAFSLPINDQVFTMQSKVIRHIADKNDDAIIVNGIADYALEDYDNVLKVFIHAPLDYRVKRVEEGKGAELTAEDKKDLKKHVISKDKKRSNYYNYYTTNKWGNLKNFDLTINSDIGVDEVAKIIVDIYKNM